MSKKSTCSPNMTYVLCLVIVGLIVYLLYSNYKESFYSEKVVEILKEAKEDKEKELKELTKETKKAQHDYQKAKKQQTKSTEERTTESKIKQKYGKKFSSV